MIPPAASARAIDAPSFSTSRFRAEREADWIAFDLLLAKLENKGAAALTSDELLQLPLLYRATLSSLSIARATSLDKALLGHLEALSIRGYFLVYGVRESRLNRLRRFFLYDWPPAVRSVWKETIIIALFIILGALTSYSLVASNPEWYFNFVPEDMAGGRDPRATVEFLRSTLGHGKAAVMLAERLLVEAGRTIHDAGSGMFRRVQTGSVGNYALVLGLGMFALVCIYMLLRG